MTERFALEGQPHIRHRNLEATPTESSDEPFVSPQEVDSGEQAPQKTTEESQQHREKNGEKERKQAEEQMRRLFMLRFAEVVASVAETTLEATERDEGQLIAKDLQERVIDAVGANDQRALDAAMTRLLMRGIAVQPQLMGLPDASQNPGLVASEGNARSMIQKDLVKLIEARRNNRQSEARATLLVNVSELLGRRINPL